MNKTISVIISVKNGENYVAEAIESIIAQDYKEKEIVVVDDGSTDGTVEILHSLDHKISFVSQENRGLGAGRNRAISIASGDYFAFLDHDDLWTPNKLSLQMDAVERSDDEPLVFTHLKQFICPTLSDEEGAKLEVDTSIVPGYIAGTLLLSRKRFFEVGPFFEKNEVGEFIDWYCRASEMNLPRKILPDVTLLRRVHLSNMGRQENRYNRNHYLHILKQSLDRRRALV